MSAPTNVRVEATSITTTVLRWSYGGAANVFVYRSPDGVSYTNISFTTSSVTTYTDTGLSVGTKYWYKLSDDAGSTFSSVVTVWTHTCAGPSGNIPTIGLPAFKDVEDVSPERLNELNRRIESAIQNTTYATDMCIACPSDGAVVIDCSDGCNNWTVIADQDINSISIQWCNQFDGTIDFVLPANTSGRQICGFPAGFGFTGDECIQAPLSSGANGRRMSVAFAGGGSGGGSASAGGSGSIPSAGRGIGRGSGGGGGGGGGCTCVPGAHNALTIKSCNANNSLDCSNTKKNRLIACGGLGPYTWTKTGTITLSVTEGESTVINPPTNSGSGVAGVAYNKSWHFCTSCAAGACAVVGTNGLEGYGCNDQVTHACPGGGVGCTPTAPSAGSMTCCQQGVGCTCLPDTCATSCTGVVAQCDARTAQMIADGCSPCGLAADGATVTVTDVTGKQATIILRS